MRSYHHLAHSLVITSLSAVFACSVQAQGEYEDSRPKVISRACLWNGDNTMWKTLGLKHSQIAKLDELRRLYPAVVDGQWIAVDEAAPVPVLSDQEVGSNISSSLSGPAGSTGTAAGSSTAGTKAQAPDLQSRLEEVLTPAQLRNWAQRCKRR